MRSIKKVQSLLSAIESIKEAIVMIYNDDHTPFYEKTERITELQLLLRKTQNACCVIIQDELDNIEGVA